MSSSVLAHKRNLWHMKNAHPNADYVDKFLKRKGEQPYQTNGFKFDQKLH